MQKRNKTDNKKLLKELIEQSAVITDTDRAILLERLDHFSNEKVEKLIGLLQEEQDKIFDFGNDMKKLKIAYKRDLGKGKRKLMNKIEDDEKGIADDFINQKFKEL